MNYFFRKISHIFDHIVTKEKDPIDRARIRMLAYILFSYLLFTGILTIIYLISGETLHLIRVATVFVIAVIMIAVTYYKQAWKIVSHTVLWLSTIAIWTNLSIYVHGVNIETLQYVWLGSVLSFYMHGSKWGWFYAAINILPIMAYTAIDNKNYFYIGNGPHVVAQSTYLFVTTYNFFLTVFLQYYFFKTFNKNFGSLKKTQNELKVLNKQLKTSLAKVENLSDARMEFLSTMSHELRTPLHGVIGISNALLMQNPRQDQEENLAILKFSAENLLLLINDVLDFNKFNSDNVKLENTSFNLEELIQNNHATLKLKADEKMINLSLQIDKRLKDKYVKSDPTRLTQILSNLITNAIKFTHKGQVSLDVQILKLEVDRMNVQFLIEDTGIGIVPTMLENVFEPFVQASSSTSRQYGGTGLGLPIVKKILRMFNSEIELTSSLNVGTKISFVIDFNFKQLNASKINPPKASRHELAHLKILVVEDHKINILVMEKTLQRWDIIPEIAENGKIALEKIAQNNFDLIMMDLHMPEMDGYVATANIRRLENKSKAKIPIMALTASVDNDVVEKILDAGMNDYLAKPFNPEHLFKKIIELTTKY